MTIKYYGARGITISEEWLDIRNFVRDMGIPEPGMTVERIDNSKGYCKENCKWATRAEQNSNTRWNVRVEYQGKIMTVPIASQLTGIPMHILRYRVHKGWPPDKLFVQA